MIVGQVDTEMTVMKKEVSIFKFLETGGITHDAGPYGEHQSQSDGRGNEGKVWAITIIVVFTGRNE